MDITKIYLVENCYGDSNKVYIGKTKTKYGRKYNHKRKYGEQVIYTYIDETCSTNYNDWEPLETFWINYFKFLGFEIMNNRKKGGSGPEYLTEEWKNHHSKIMKGKPKPKNFGINHSLKTKGKSKHTEESKKQISSKLKNHPSFSSEKRKQAIGKANSTPVKQLSMNGDLIKIWSSQNEIQRTLGFPQTNISACCLGKQKTAYGFKWCF